MPSKLPGDGFDWFKLIGAGAILFGAVQAYGSQASDIKNNRERIAKLEATVDQMGAMNVRMARIEVTLELIRNNLVMPKTDGKEQ